jgi:hypothetical protein
MIVRWTVVRRLLAAMVFATEMKIHAPVQTTAVYHHRLKPTAVTALTMTVAAGLTAVTGIVLMILPATAGPRNHHVLKTVIAALTDAAKKGFACNPASVSFFH